MMLQVAHIQTLIIPTNKTKTKFLWLNKFLVFFLRKFSKNNEKLQTFLNYFFYFDLVVYKIIQFDGKQPAKTKQKHKSKKTDNHAVFLAFKVVKVCRF